MSALFNAVALITAGLAVLLVLTAVAELFERRMHRRAPLRPPVADSRDSIQRFRREIGKG